MSKPISKMSFEKVITNTEIISWWVGYIITDAMYNVLFPENDENDENNEYDSTVEFWIMNTCFN